MVTMARIVLLPLPCAMLLYGEGSILWICLCLYVFLGFTDFIDGYMARRDGPTRFGGLIDPVADKIFMAAIILPLVAGGADVRCPAWVAGALFSRELLVTALRSAASYRDAAIRTSNLAKMKTITQMGGVGTVFLSTRLADHPDLLMMAGVLLTLPFAGIWLFFKLKRQDRPPPYFAAPVTAGFIVWTLLSQVHVDTSVLIQFIVIVTMTWVSGIDYLLGALSTFRAAALKRADYARLLWALGHGALVPSLTGSYKAAVLPILVALSAELATGGVDNVVVAEKKQATVWPFLLSGLLATALFCLATWLPLGFKAEWVPWASGVLALTSLVTLSSYFKEHRALFAQSLDQPKREA
ncbi:MAG: hypothetical protein CMP23_04660 [Rickettsiales bacterium]|nr:hypothetical protein [Rickettsiales bacterium]|tara:strand:- start:869 stop:1930 length:1062 start_codon:yes stop_codon:yes gene_type:complete